MKRILNENAYEDENESTGYGFWLWFLLIIIAYNGIKAAVGLFQNFQAYDILNMAYVNLTFIIALFAAVGFFTRKRWTPLLFISFLLLSLLYISYSTFVLAFSFPEKIDYFSLVRVVIMCALAIPYLLRSDRVKEVFTR